MTGLPNEATIQRRLTPARFNVAKDGGFRCERVVTLDNALQRVRPCPRGTDSGGRDYTYDFTPYGGRSHISTRVPSSTTRAEGIRK
jgi:hypothetical protein